MRSISMPEMVALAIAITLSACEHDRRERSEPRSNQITIDLSTGSVDTFRLSPESTLLDTDGQGYPLERASDGILLADDRVLLADAGAGQVLEFDGSGRLVRAFGGRGEGPGEFRNLRSIDQAPGDSIVAFDAGTRRLTVFDGQGGYARAAFVRLGGVRGGLPIWVHVDGAVTDRAREAPLFVGLATFVPDYLMEPNGPAWRDTVSILRLDSQGNVTDTLAKVENGWWQRLPADDAYRITAVRDGPFAYIDASRELMYLARGDDTRIRVVRLTDGEILDHLTVGGLRGRPFSGPGGLEGRLYLAGMTISEGGDIWLADAGENRTTDPRIWHVFEASGEPVAVAILPERTRILAVSDRYLLGVTRDEYDVERGVLFDLRGVLGARGGLR